MDRPRGCSRSCSAWAGALLGYLILTVGFGTVIRTSSISEASSVSSCSRSWGSTRASGDDSGAH
jgi:hypothetical protein